ncbi:hypothetical protein BC835DRAFT_158017 [Cytidiella melzeri]|nr:hypothetical protein BC835DRAFT_158017 [Cytidiella melzeri]
MPWPTPSSSVPHHFSRATTQQDFCCHVPCIVGEVTTVSAYRSSSSHEGANSAATEGPNVASLNTCSIHAITMNAPVLDVLLLPPLPPIKVQTSKCRWPIRFGQRCDAGRAWVRFALYIASVHSVFACTGAFVVPFVGHKVETLNKQMRVTQYGQQMHAEKV